MITPNQIAELKGLAEALRTHAYDDCRGRDVPTHIANIGAHWLLSLLAEIEALRAENDMANARLAAADMLVGDGFIETVQAALDRAGAPRKSDDGMVTFGIVHRISLIGKGQSNHDEA